MARRVIKEVGEWVRECQTLVRKDLDNVVLFTGPEGVGKSTLMYQVMKNLDPTFSLSRIGFDIPSFISAARKAPKYSAVASDEFLANRRKAMHRGTVDLLDFLQECRGLNLHLAICFPHVDLLDRAIMDYRVRWHIHIPVRGVFHLSEAHNFYQPGGVTSKAWRVIGKWRFNPLQGPEWDLYKDAKAKHMMGRGSIQEESEEENEWLPHVDILRGLPSEYEAMVKKARGLDVL